MSEKRTSPFPYLHWSDITRYGWVDTVVEWFDDNYARIPQPAMASQTMEQLLTYIFEALRESKGADVTSNAMRELGRRLQHSQALQSNLAQSNPHHLRIASILEHDVRSPHAHMFILPEISKDSLLTRPDYSTLILAAKLHASGEYEKARQTALGVARGCGLAQYIIGQSERKLGFYEQASIHLEQGIDLLARTDCACPFNSGAVPICDTSLLKAALFRAKAVILRNRGNRKESELAFAAAEDIAENAMRKERNKQNDPSESTEDTIWVDNGHEGSYLIAADVVADIYFSHGYYFYSSRDYEQAERLFEKSITALVLGGLQWDSPYTRLAIVKLCASGNYEEAKGLFVKARTLCEETPTRVNREAPLSLSLCTLGLRIIEMVYSKRPLIFQDPLADLEKAIEQEPRLALGPLECHISDAKHLLDIKLPKPAKNLVEEFIQRLEKEVVKKRKTYDSTEDLGHVGDNLTTILFVAADPSDATRLRLNEEAREIQEKLQLAKMRELFKFEQRWSVRPEDLSQALIDVKPQIVHFSGHGTSAGSLCLEDQLGKTHPVQPDALAALFELVADQVQCVVLNACYSETQATAISTKHISYVIGMSQALGDKAAIAFAVGFYQALGGGRSIEDAYKFGCVQIRLQGIPEHLTPVLIKKEQVDS